MASQITFRSEKYTALPLGARFRYLGGKDIWVILEHYGHSQCGTIAKWDGLVMNYLGQTICCAGDSRKEVDQLIVEVVVE